MSSGPLLSSSCTHRIHQLALLTKPSFKLMGNLPAPIRSKLFNRYGNSHYQACVCSMQGYRANMEDSHLIHLSFSSHTQYSLFAIFDGHNGRRAAQHLSQALISKLDALPTLTDNSQIQQIVLAMDEQFCKSQHGQSGSTVVFAIVKPILRQTIANNSRKIPETKQSLHKTDSNTPNVSDALHNDHSRGSTVSIDDNIDSKTTEHMTESSETYEIRIFWAGDSRALLIFENKTEKTYNFKALTTDHRPNNPSEKIRIEIANGLIINNRVDSKLAVSRAFGDCNLKNNTALAWDKQRVTALMECTTITAHKNDKLFLFCDGLVEYLENKPLCRLLYQHLNKYEDPVYGLGYLFDEVLEGGSRDNMSAVIINFTDGTQYGTNGRHKTFLPGPLYMTRNDNKFVSAYLRNAKDFGHSDTPKLRRAAYREDLKFLRKYGSRGLSRQQLHYGRTVKSIMSEIEAVIKDIDEKVKNVIKPVCEMKLSNGKRGTGSTEIIEDGSRVDHTPPLSDCDGNEEKEVRNGSGDRIAMEKSLTHINTSEIESESKSKEKKRTFLDMNGTNGMKEKSESALKRRKLNVGEAKEIHFGNGNNEKSDNNTIESEIKNGNNEQRIETMTESVSICNDSIILKKAINNGLNDIHKLDID